MINVRRSRLLEDLSCFGDSAEELRLAARIALQALLRAENQAQRIGIECMENRVRGELRDLRFDDCVRAGVSHDLDERSFSCEV